MNKNKVFLVALAAIATFLLVYTPHYNYPFPSHIDEWHHISETIRLQKGEYPTGITGFRIGFHALLLPLSKITNLVLIYQFLPSIWAVFSGLVLFYVAYKKTDNQFYTALFAMIFFASIKSNVNITGLWFFTPLSFCIPFIFLYVYFFTEGLERQNKKFILLSLLIMAVLLPLHSISVLFAIPFLSLYTLFHLRYVRRIWKFFSIFLLLPLMGILFYKFVAKIPWNALINDLTYALRFKHGWGVLELKNSFFELYSLVGYMLAIIGLGFIFIDKDKLKRYLAYGLWPITILISIMVFRISDVSYLSPYQRNLYYFAIGLPMLSAFGLDYLFKLIKKSIDGIMSAGKRELFKKIGLIVIFIIIIFLTFESYWYIPKQIDLYKVIDRDDYEAISSLSAFPKTTVMAIPRISTALYPISGHTPVATFFFYGNRPDAERFFHTPNCGIKQQILEKYKVKYVLSKSQIPCGWKLIYDEGDYIYEID